MALARSRRCWREHVGTAGRVHDPSRGHRLPLSPGRERHAVRPALLVGLERHVEINRVRLKHVPAAREIATKQLAFDLVAVELIRRHVRQPANVRLAVAFEPAGVLAGGLPVKAQVVLQVVLAQQVFLELEHFGKVVAAYLNGRFADLLPARRNLPALVDLQDADRWRRELQLTRQREAGEARPNDQDLVVAVCARAGHR